MFHVSQKPVSLLRYLIRTYTQPGELVLDNTAGSFSTGVAAVQEGRRFIGIELSEEYCAVGQRRIEESLSQPALPFEEPSRRAKPTPQPVLFD